MQVSVDNGFHFLFQSTPSSRRVTHGFKRPINNYWISIHALLTEGDNPGLGQVDSMIPISIHALLTEGDPKRNK